MAAFIDWLAGVLREGHSRLASPPHLSSTERPAAERQLIDASRIFRREVAGPPVAFDAALAVRAAELLAAACWHLSALSPDSPLPANELGAPQSASDHYSGDLLLRHLASVRRRAALRGPADPLATWCEQLLRAWPLSGVLMTCRDGPTTRLDFDGHPGLLTLYAERLAARPEPSWVPSRGAARDYAERASGEAGRPIPVIPAHPPERVA